MDVPALGNKYATDGLLCASNYIVGSRWSNNRKIGKLGVFYARWGGRTGWLEKQGEGTVVAGGGDDEVVPGDESESGSMIHCTR